MMQKRPNILIIMVDQLNGKFFPDGPADFLHAPHLKSLAARSARFRNNYTSSPLCAPARASFMAGQLPSRTRVYDNAAEYVSSIPTYAHHLRRAGYYTALSGKMHFVGPDQLHGFEERLTTDIYPADFGWTPDWDHPHDRPTWYHDMSSVTEAGPCVRSNQLDFDEEVTFAAERSLFGHTRSGDERPFCYVVSYTHPHDPFTIPRPWWDRYEGADIPLPRPTDRGDLHPHERRLREVCAMDDVTVTDDQVRAARRAYYGAISFVDDQIARLLTVLRETNRLDDTVVIVTSDHGEMLGERGAWYKMSFYEGSARVPLLVSSPGRFKPRRVAAAVSTMDLVPTLVDLAAGDDANREGGTLVGPLDGHSVLPHLTGQPDRDEAIGEYLAEGAIAPIVMIRRGRHKFIHSLADPDELFDLGADPDERVNLANDPDCADLVAGFRREAAARWDLTALDRSVRLSQQRRLAVSAALGTGIRAPWDYAPGYDAAHRYIRNDRDLGDLEREARFPPAAQGRT
jgi:choline-sulfatase